MIKPNFTSQLASDLVFAIMALNDALHTGSQSGPSSNTSPNFPRPVTVVTPGLFSAPCHDLSKADFVSVFRQHDPDEVLSDRTLSRIYLSIKAEPLVQALDRFEPRFTIRVKGGKLPTRLTYAQPAEPVTLVIPAPDPDLAIRLYAQDTTFEPPILTFANSNEASFTMWTKSLGPKQVVFVRAGRNARFYGGTEVDSPDTPASGPALDGGVAVEDSPLPRSFNVTVERAFMKHSFTLSSISSNGSGDATKRFMFSFESESKVQEWTKLIKEQVEKEVKAKALRAKGEDGVKGRANDALALQVLRESLVVADETAPAAAPGAGGGLGRAATFSSAGLSSALTPTAKGRVGHGGELGRSSNNTAAPLGLGLTQPATPATGLRAPYPPSSSALSSTSSSSSSAMLDRTTSTSRHYYAASGVGRHERELLIPPSTSSALGSVAESTPSTAPGGKDRGLTHTKQSASLSVYPPSTMVTRGLSPLTTTMVGRSNSARSASSPHSTEAPLLPAKTNGLTRTASTGSASTTAGGVAAHGKEGKVLPGTQIVNIARLNSLLAGVIAWHQAQAQVQVQAQQHMS